MAFLRKEDIPEGGDRFICTINSQVSFPCGIHSAGNDTYYITVNKQVQKELGAQMGDEIEISLQIDTSKYGMPMPIELQTALEQDSLADHYFHDLTPGKQRNLIYIVNQAKQSETRIKKALVIVNYLLSTSGKLDFKELNLAFKDANRK